jgi:hypothetical protein
MDNNLRSNRINSIRPQIDAKQKKLQIRTVKWVFHIVKRTLHN